MCDDTNRIIANYHAAFNRHDADAMLALVANDVVHEPSQGCPRLGKAAFAEFLAHMNNCYAETVIEPVILSSPDGVRAAAEFALHGCYIACDAGLPEARNQTYALPVGAFLEVTDGKIKLA